MKKFLALFMAVIMIALACFACDKKNPDTNGDPDAQPAGDLDVSALNGVELEKFAIVYDTDCDYAQRAAEYIKAEILARTELDLVIRSDSEEVIGEYEIVVGETSRDISTRLNADTKNVQFAILAEDKQIALEGDYFIIAAAAYFFVETYVPTDDFSADIPKQVSIHEPIKKEAKNFILLIGDGMGVNQTKLFQNFANGSDFDDGEDIFYGYYLPNQGFSRTDSLDGTTDSAAGGTALSSGLKTRNGYVGQDKTHSPVTSLTELAASLGKSTAVMSTEVSTGATPASFSAHANNRSDASDILAGQAALTEQYGTIINCGYDHYEIAEIEGKVTTTLDTLDNDEDGFFLMYEEAHIDKHCHDRDAEETFYALLRFNQVIARFMEYAFYNPDTFVLITADHETGALRISSQGRFVYMSSNHSSDDVPVFAYGDGSELFNGKTIENIQIPQTIASFMGNHNFGDQSTHKALTK